MTVSFDFSAYKHTHILVVGDVMLDRYWEGQTSRISPEAPVPVVHVQGVEERPGGAGNVALNITSLGGKADLVGITGDDENGGVLESLLEQGGVSCDFQVEKSIRTSTKLRILSKHQQLLRADFEDDFRQTDTASFIARFKEALTKADVIILSDYGKGTLCEVETLIRLAEDRGKKVLVDPKGTDFTRYRGATVVTPNRSEFEAVVGCCETEQQLEEKAESLRAELELEALLITRGEEGMTLVQKGLPPKSLPTHAKDVYDVTGAGDTVIATLAVSLAAGEKLSEALKVANAAAGIVVAKVGTATASIEEINDILWRYHNEISPGIVTEYKLRELIKQVREQGERVIMTNGCFDLLHVGHVAFLNQARELGDRLIVAVNDDNSVRRLKGHDRPVNKVHHRMEVLAGLRSVDWVVPFSEDTPERLYCDILPDVLVKGGDYLPEHVAGGGCVKDNGGEVIILNYIEGHSTSAMVRKVRGN